MRDHDALDRNPNVSRAALEAVHGHVHGWALSRCGYDKAAAEDLVQEAYVAILSGKARFDNKSSLKTFVFGVVQNLARSRYRRQRNRMRIVDTYAAGLDDVDDGPVEEIGLKRVWEAVESLPERQRDITELVFVRELTVEEASAVMGISAGTGSVHYARAMKSLAEKLTSLKTREQAR